jgi:hypothetical protein
VTSEINVCAGVGLDAYMNHSGSIGRQLILSISKSLAEVPRLLPYNLMTYDVVVGKATALTKWPEK